MNLGRNPLLGHRLVPSMEIGHHDHGIEVIIMPSCCSLAWVILISYSEDLDPIVLSK
jgi:hypothetical protein